VIGVAEGERTGTIMQPEELRADPRARRTPPRCLSPSITER